MAQVWWVSCSMETSAGQSPAKLTRPNTVGLWAGLMPVAREQAMKRTETAFSVRLGFAGCDCTEYDNETAECGISPGGWCGEGGHRKGRRGGAQSVLKEPDAQPSRGEGLPSWHEAPRWGAGRGARRHVAGPQRPRRGLPLSPPGQWEGTGVGRGECRGPILVFFKITQATEER